MPTREPFTIEFFVGRSAFPPHKPKWVEVLDIPNANEDDARAWLRAQGYQWTIRRTWRIVDRQGTVIKELQPDFTS